MSAAKRSGPALIRVSRPAQDTQARQRHNHTPSRALFNDQELAALDLKRSRDGALLDNRDGFYDAYPDDFLRTYDARTCIAISRSLLEKLILALEAA